VVSNSGAGFGDAEQTCRSRSRCGQCAGLEFFDPWHDHRDACNIDRCIELAAVPSHRRWPQLPPAGSEALRDAEPVASVFLRRG